MGALMTVVASAENVGFASSIDSRSGVMVVVVE